jgi:hypothetical protein
MSTSAKKLELEKTYPAQKKSKHYVKGKAIPVTGRGGP